MTSPNNERAQAVINEFMALIRGLEGIRQAYDVFPDKLGAFPSAVGYFFTGTWNLNTTEDLKGLHDIVIEIHVSSKYFRVGVDQSIPYNVLVPVALWRAIPYTEFDTFQSIQYEYGALGYDAMDTFGWRFRIVGVKTRVNI